MSTAQMSLVTVTVDGQPLGVFDTLSGGETSAEPTKRRAGGMGAQKSYPALPDTDDLTVSRVYERERDHEKLRKLRRRVGRAEASVSEQPLDEDGAPWGRPTTYTGRLTGVNPGEADSESSDPRMFELTFQITEVD
jgi:hypothetical protein